MLRASELDSKVLHIPSSSLFINMGTLLSNVVFATKGTDGKVVWVTLKPEYHGQLMRGVFSLLRLHTIKIEDQIAFIKNTPFTFIL
jgi:hypothetical protein